MNRPSSDPRRSLAWRIPVAIALPSVLLLALVGRLVHIQRSLSAEFEPRLDVQHRARVEIPARRGMILDTRGRVLAGSRPMPRLYADPLPFIQNPELFPRLAAELRVAQDRLEMELRGGNPRFSWLPEECNQRAEEILAKKLVGVGVKRLEKRVYPMGPSCAHVLGFVGGEGTGLEGIEKVYDQHLAGLAGSYSSFVTVSRRAIAESDDPMIPPRDGGHVVLTIDSVIQDIAERALKTQIDTFGAREGIAIVLDPYTGEILAMASWPQYAPDDFAQSEPAARRNLALTDPLEPGSTMKPFVASWALAKGVVKTTDAFDCHMGACSFGKRVIHDTKPHGLLTVPQIVIKSSNIGMAFIGLKLGNDLLYEGVRRFGFGEKTGIELPGEDEGIVRPRHKWNSYSTTSVPFGQEISVTPIQLAAAFAALVNDGVLLKPRIVKALLDAQGMVVESHDGPEQVRQVIPAEVARYFCSEILTRVVSDNRSNGARIEGYSVLGKTGTAQVASRSARGYEEQAYTSSFVGAAPASNPRLVALVMIRRPEKSKGHFGAQVAAPAAGAIFREALAYLEVPRDLTPEQERERDVKLAQMDE